MIEVDEEYSDWELIEVEDNDSSGGGGGGGGGMPVSYTQTTIVQSGGGVSDAQLKF